MFSTITIALTTICDAAASLSSYEAREQKDAQGESMYERVKIQERDYPQLQGFIKDAAAEVEKQLMPALRSTVGLTDVVFTASAGYDVPDTVSWVIERCITCWVLGAWLEDKAAQRAGIYMTNCQRMLADIRTKIYRAKPSEPSSNTTTNNTTT